MSRKMDWDRVRAERLMRIRGCDPYGPPVTGGELGDHWRRVGSNADQKTHVSPLTNFFDQFVSQTRTDENLKSLAMKNCANAGTAASQF